MSSSILFKTIARESGVGEPDKSRYIRHKKEKRTKGYYRKTVERIERVRNCDDIIKGWGTDPLSLAWWHVAFDLLRPPPATTISQWADRVRRISSEAAAEPGDWDTSKLECMRAVMDACSPNDPCTRVVLIKSAQTGGTEAAVLNVIGFVIDVNPRSMLIVYPSLEMAEAFSRERLDPMIRDNQTLRDKVTEFAYAQTNKVGPVRRKRYPGGFLNILGANSTSGLSTRPVPIVIMDEVDRCIKNAGRDGNPTRLLTTRATTFPDRKEIFVSSPSCSKDETGILALYEDSTQEEWQLQCPNTECQGYHFLVWEHMQLETVTYQCPRCQQSAPQWQWQAQPGAWIVKNPDHRRTRGFKINGLISPWLDWGELCDDYKIAKIAEDHGDDSLMRVFVNNKLAETYEQLGKRVEVDLFQTRREVYECHSQGFELPDGVLLLTAGVDIQDSFIAYEVIGWGRGKESWGIETGEFQGDPRSPDTKVWEQLDYFVYDRIWNYTDGKATRTRIMCVDSGGHCTEEVYNYCKQRHPRAFAIKGVKGIGTSIIIGGRKRKRGAAPWIVQLGIDTLKEELHARLRVKRPGPGYCHFPKLDNDLPACGYTPEFFQEIMSEQRVLRYTKGGFAQFEWTKARTDANEALDCRNYARGGLEYLKVRLEEMQRDVLTPSQLTNLGVHEIEIGTGKRISITSKQSTERIVGKKTRYGTGEQLSQTTDRVGRTVNETQGRTYYGASSSTAGGYGVSANTSF